VPKPDRLAALRTASRVGEHDRFDSAAARLVTGSETVDGALHQLPLAKVRPNPDQPRRTFAPEALQELAESIRAVGVLQPILVRRAAAGNYEIVAGERRWRAAQQAGFERIPAVVQSFDDEVALEASLTENLQREDLSPLEEAQIFLRMTTELGYSVRRLAERLGKGKGYVESRLRLARMEPDLQALVAARPDTLTHAREIEQVEDAAQRQELIARVQAGSPLQEIRQDVKRARQRRGQPIPTPEDAATEVSGRPDTSLGNAPVRPAAGDATVEAPGVVTAGSGNLTAATPHPVVDAARRLHRAIEDATAPPGDPALRAALRRELALVATAIQSLIVRLDGGEKEP
jgi:ParB family chromosome partitioning protein